jgi:thioredoxin 1
MAVEWELENSVREIARMITRRTALRLTAGALATAALPALPGFALAAERVPFDRAAFEAALKAGQPVLVDVSATWCITCKQQHSVLDKLFGMPKYAGFTVFTVDYDTQKDVMRSFGVQQRATLIVFRNGKEVDRSSWQTGEAAIEALLAKAV